MSLSSGARSDPPVARARRSGRGSAGSGGGEFALAELLDAQRAQHRGNTGAAQRQIGLVGLLAKPLQQQRGPVADAIDRKERDVGAADEAGQEVWPLFDAAVMMNEPARGLLDDHAQPRDLVWPTADIEQGQAAEIKPLLRALRASSIELRFEHLDFAAQRDGFFRHRRVGALGLLT